LAPYDPSTATNIRIVFDTSLFDADKSITADSSKLIKEILLPIA